MRAYVRLKETPPLFKMIHEAALKPSVMVQPQPGKILFAFGLNKARTILFMRCPYTPKRVLPIKM